MEFSVKRALVSVGLAAVLVATPVLASAQRQDDHRHDDRGNNGRPGNNNIRPGNNGRPGNSGRPNWHFDQNSRNQWNRYYRNDAMRWRNNRNRPRFTPGYVIPRTYAIRPVPRSYWNGMAPPPPGYQYGYYDGYVVAYDPTTRIVADVVDLVAGLAGH